MPSATRSSRRRRRTQAERRDASEARIIDATIKLIAEQGTTQVSFADIAAEAECSRALPGYLFGTKTSLLEALIEHVEQTWNEIRDDRLVATDNPIETIRDMVNTIITEIDSHEPTTRALTVLRTESLIPGSPLRDMVNRVDPILEELFEELFVAAAEQGQIRHEFDAGVCAAVMAATLHGLSQRAARDPGSWAADQYTDIILASIDATFDTQHSTVATD